MTEADKKGVYVHSPRVGLSAKEISVLEQVAQNGILPNDVDEVVVRRIKGAAGFLARAILV